MKIKDFLPEDLSKILNSSEFDDEAGMLIESVKYIDEDLVVGFSIRFDKDKGMATQLWQINVIGLEEEHIKRNWMQSIDFYSNHILLLEYHDIHTELYFNGTTGNAQDLYLDIIQSLLQLSTNWADISKYLFSPKTINELSQQGYGLFARGPKTVLRIYKQCLVKHGIKSNFIGEFEPTPANKSLKLLQLGESFFIAHSFFFERII